MEIEGLKHPLIPLPGTPLAVRQQQLETARFIDIRNLVSHVYKKLGPPAENGQPVLVPLMSYNDTLNDNRFLVRKTIMLHELTCTLQGQPLVVNDGTNIEVPPTAVQQPPPGVQDGMTQMQPPIPQYTPPPPPAGAAAAGQIPVQNYAPPPPPQMAPQSYAPPQQPQGTFSNPPPPPHLAVVPEVAAAAPGGRKRRGAGAAPPPAAPPPAQQAYAPPPPAAPPGYVPNAPPPPPQQQQMAPPPQAWAPPGAPAPLVPGQWSPPPVPLMTAPAPAWAPPPPQAAPVMAPNPSVGAADVGAILTKLDDVGRGITISVKNFEEYKAKIEQMQGQIHAQHGMLMQLLVATHHMYLQNPQLQPTTQGKANSLPGFQQYLEAYLPK